MIAIVSPTYTWRLWEHRVSGDSYSVAHLHMEIVGNRVSDDSYRVAHLHMEIVGTQGKWW